MAFPTGPICNLGCEYCYYLEKTELYPNSSNFMMDEALLEEYTKQYIDAHPGPHVVFGWQGGEPTLRGLGFYQRAVELQKQYAPAGWQIRNSFQTNGTLIDEEWCQFFKEHQFLVGISLDGPARLHNHYRKGKALQDTHDQVVRAVNLLQQYGVEFNVLCVVNDVNSRHPLEVYNFMKELGIDFMQFIPLVEKQPNGDISARTVDPERFGHFLITIFNHWARHDLGEIYVQIFEEAVAAWAGIGPSLCEFQETCGLALVMEHNGDLYSCDHFVLHEHKLGNITTKTIAELVQSDQQHQFGLSKKDLPAECLACDVRFICNGGCMRNRLTPTAEERPLNYLCQGYKLFFRYIDPFMRTLVPALRQGISSHRIRAALSKIHDELWGNVNRNDQCPCGSGKKFKKCCIELI